MTPEQAAELRRAFPKSAIGKLPKGGTQLDYVGHAAVTDRLLSIDPEWSWEPFALDESGLPALDRAGNLWIRLTVCGVTRVGVGDGKSAKEVIGDAIRNAAMRFGVALDLWSKEELESGHLPEPPAPAPALASDAQRRKLFALFTQKGITEEQQRKGLGRYMGLPGPVESRSEATAAAAARFIEWLETQPDAEVEPEVHDDSAAQEALEVAGGTQ